MDAAGPTLHAVAFDLTRLEVRGTPVPIVPRLLTMAAGASDVVVSQTGTLAYVDAPAAAASAARVLVWVDRQGREETLQTPARRYGFARIAPDGRGVAVGADGDIWIGDLARGNLTRMSGPAGHAVWAPDGRRLFFSSQRDGARNLYAQPPDGIGAAERLTESANFQNATSVSPDGRRLIFFETAAGTADILQLALDGSREVTPLVRTPFNERNGVVSPDGRWLAYEANDSGQFEIYVRPYPNVNGGKWQVSTGGGTRPLWSRDGRELFYLTSVVAGGAHARRGRSRRQLDCHRADEIVRGTLFLESERR